MVWDFLPVNFEDFEGLDNLEKRETLCIIQQMRILHNLICVSLLVIYLFTFSTQKTIIGLLELFFNLYGSRVRNSTGLKNGFLWWSLYKKFINSTELNMLNIKSN